MDIDFLNKIISVLASKAIYLHHLKFLHLPPFHHLLSQSGNDQINMTDNVRSWHDKHKLTKCANLTK